MGTLDLRAFTRNARAVERHAGRSMSSPRMLLCVWPYAISQGIGSVREIARLCQSDVAFGRIAGDVSVSHQVLSEFRVGHRAAFDALMNNVLASLMHKGLLSLDTVAQDGTRVRVGVRAVAPTLRLAPGMSRAGCAALESGTGRCRQPRAERSAEGCA